MAYKPQFTSSAHLLSLVEEIAVLRERIQGAAVSVSWIPAFQKDTRTRNGHASTAIEGNPLTLEQVRAFEEGRELAAADRRSSREVLNYFAGLRYVELAGFRQRVKAKAGIKRPGLFLFGIRHDSPGRNFFGSSHCPVQHASHEPFADLLPFEPQIASQTARQGRRQLIVSRKLRCHRLWQGCSLHRCR